MQRGERLNNPFNIEKSKDKWQGLIVPGSDKVFCEFKTPVYGLRAGFIDLLNQPKEGYNTVYKIITKYAPPKENNTNAYIKAVCKYINANPDDILDLDDYETLYHIGCAIILHEQGEIIYSDAQINQAMQLAGVHNVPKAGVVQRVINALGAA